MNFSTFCNICFTKENIMKYPCEEHEAIINSLTSFTSCPDIEKSIIYLCTNCCNKLEELNNFRELYLTNFVRFRYLYKEQKKQLEMRNAPDTETKLEAFVQVNVERPSGTPLIESYEAAQVLRNDTTCNVDIYEKESDDDFTKTDLNELLKNELSDRDISFSPENSTLENDTKICLENYENYCFYEDQENNGSTVVEKRSTENEVIKTTSDTVCNVCDESCSCTSGLDVHVCTHTGEKHNCAKCQKTFGDTSTLEKHECVYNGEISYDCDECGLRFINPSILKRHQLKHTGEKPYKCDECGYECLHRSTLDVHKRKHTGERPFKCDECGMGFINQSSLKSHKFLHTDERPFTCDECGVGYIQRSNLITHKFIHTGEKPFKCEECGAAFTRRYTLNLHKRLHTGEKRYKCDKCAFSCNNLRKLNTHKVSHTNE